MKKAALVLYAAIVALFPPTAYNGGFVTYAVMRQSSALFSESGEIICYLPATYYAVICGEESGGKYPVSYLDLSGYMNVSDVTVTDYEPVVKFAALSARPNNDGMAVNLRDRPQTDGGKVLCPVPPNAELTLYGNRSGDELFAGAGNVWQYVKYVAPGGGTYFGYVYSPQLICDEVTPNSGEIVQKPPEKDNTSETPASLLPDKTGAAVLAAVLCVPAGIIMLVLFYRPDSKRTPRHSTRE